tara:strand:- start:1483 stop:2106 length:624 start_codon:yes stop_codon:yes gene_type:complete
MSIPALVNRLLDTSTMSANDLARLRSRGYGVLDSAIEAKEREQYYNTQGVGELLADSRPQPSLILEPLPKQTLNEDIRPPTPMPRPPNPFLGLIPDTPPPEFDLTKILGDQRIALDGQGSLMQPVQQATLADGPVTSNMPSSEQINQILKFMERQTNQQPVQQATYGGPAPSMTNMTEQGVGSLMPFVGNFTVTGASNAPPLSLPYT